MDCQHVRLFPRTMWGFEATFSRTNMTRRKYVASLTIQRGVVEATGV